MSSCSCSHFARLLKRFAQLLVLTRVCPCWWQGYGTVRFETAEAAQAAIKGYHGTDLEGRTLTVRCS